jgi:hypothetical protein
MKKLLMGAFALTMMTGSALAAGGTTSALDNKDMMGAFYTDADMKTMKSDDEFKAAWMALKPEDRDTITKECSNDTEKLHNDFCEMTKKLGGAN